MVLEKDTDSGESYHTPQPLARTQKWKRLKRQPAAYRNCFNGRKEPNVSPRQRSSGSASSTAGRVLAALDTVSPIM